MAAVASSRSLHPDTSGDDGDHPLLFDLCLPAVPGDGSPEGNPQRPRGMHPFKRMSVAHSSPQSLLPPRSPAVAAVPSNSSSLPSLDSMLKRWLAALANSGGSIAPASPDKSPSVHSLASNNSPAHRGLTHVNTDAHSDFVTMLLNSFTLDGAPRSAVASPAQTTTHTRPASSIGGMVASVMGYVAGFGPKPQSRDSNMLPSAHTFTGTLNGIDLSNTICSLTGCFHENALLALLNVLFESFMPQAQLQATVSHDDIDSAVTPLPHAASLAAFGQVPASPLLWQAKTASRQLQLRRAATVARERALSVAFPSTAVSGIVITAPLVDGTKTDAVVSTPLRFAAFAESFEDSQHEGGGMSCTSRPELARDNSQASLLSLAIAAPQHTHTAAIGDELEDGTVELNQYILLQSIGRGRQGEVFLAMDSEKNELRAVKIVSRPKGASPLRQQHAAGGPLSAARERQRMQLEREVSIMKKCRHRNVVALYEVIDDPELECMYLVMQYVEHGSVLQVNARGFASKTVAPDLLANYARQLCAGLQYLHKHGVIHRDIKPDNILLGQNEQVYLADFGMAEAFDAPTASFAAPHHIVGTRGTVAYMAPELLSATESQQAAGEAVDVWALGITFYVLLYGHLPWQFNTVPELIHHIERTPITFPDRTGSVSLGGVSSDSREPASLPSTALLPPQLSQSTKSFDVHAGEHSPRCGDDSLSDEEAASSTATYDPTKGSPADLHASWRRLLRQMLKRNPKERMTLRNVRHHVIAIDSAASQLRHVASENARAIAAAAAKDHAVDQSAKPQYAAGSAISALRRGSIRSIRLFATASNNNPNVRASPALGAYDIPLVTRGSFV
jgi:serine/threonine protein kinase